MEEKLTRKKLYQKIRKPFLEMGYLEFACKNMFYGMFVKSVAGSWYLSVWPVIYSLYYDRFSVDMWLNKNTFINSEPWICSNRPELFYRDECCDGWEGLRQESVEDFLAKYRIVESKVIDRLDALSAAVETSEWTKAIVAVNSGVFNEYVRIFGNPSDGFEKFNLQKPIRTPNSWFIAATKYYEQNGTIRLNKEMAADMAFMEWMAREYASRMKK